MKKSQLISYSTVLLASALMFGCTTSDRMEEIAGIIANPQDQNQTPNSGGTLINDNNETSNGGNVFSNDENSTTGTIKINAKNAYKVAVTFSDEYNEKGYYSKGEVGELKFDITNIYTKAPADTSIIENITLNTEEKDDDNDAQGKYLNFITFKGEQAGGYLIEDDDIKATDSVAIKMEELSGTTNIMLSVKIKDIVNPFILKVPIVIEKNKSSSMAIVRMGSRYENGLFIDKFVIHVVDSYGNKAEDGTNISTGVINNPKLYSNAYNGATKQIPILDANGRVQYDYNEAGMIVSNKYLINDTTMPTNHWGTIIPFDWNINRFSVNHTDENGTIISTTTHQEYYPSIFGVNYKNDTANFNKSNGTFTLLPSDPTDVMNSDITSLDTLIILANKGQHKPENLGGWDIKSVNSNTELSLVSLDSGTDLSGVSYVIGDEYRYIDYEHAIINAAVSTFETTDVVDGLAFAELRYTPEMVGKNVFIYANTRLEDKHLGISRQILLHGTGLSNETLSCTNDKGLKPDCSMSIRIVQNDSGKGAHRVNIAQPQIAGEAVYRYTTASQTNDTGWTTVSIYGIDENKTATVSFGSLINNEYIINQK